jgi:DNA-binding transcriptional LysR family regulator
MPERYRGTIELRHLRYFVAVAEEGSLKLAAEKRLHTAQPSLSRQIRDLEDEVGAQLLQRSTRGIELTAAGRAFLAHARLSLAQAEAAVQSARRVAQTAMPVFAVGFVTGHEVDCIPPTTNILRDDLPDLEVRVSAGFRPTWPMISTAGNSTSRSCGGSQTRRSNTGRLPANHSSQSCHAITGSRCANRSFRAT